MSTRPKIAIVTEDGFNGGSANYVIRDAYTSMIREGGGLPLVAADVRCRKAYAAECDGLLLTGGIPIHPFRFGKIIPDFQEAFMYSLTRDDLDFALLDEFYRLGKPVYAIGRGFEVVVAYFGGSFRSLPWTDVQRLAALSGEEKAASRREWIDACDGSLTEALFGRKSLQWYSHTRKTEGIGSKLLVSARNEAGETEAVETADGKIYAVYWHPEVAVETPSGEYGKASPDAAKDSGGLLFFQKLVKTAGKG